MKKNDPFTREDQTRFTMRIDSDLLDQIKAEAEKTSAQQPKKLNSFWSSTLQPFPKIKHNQIVKRDPFSVCFLLQTFF